MTIATFFGAAGTAGAARIGLTWLLTYLAHGAIAGGGAAALVRLARLAPAAEHRLWKMAFFLPIATASLAALLAWRTAGTQPIAPAALLIYLPDALPVAAPAIAPARLDAMAGWIAQLAALGIASGAARFAVATARFRLRLRARRAVTDPRLLSSFARLAADFCVGTIELTESEHLASPTVLSAREICVPTGRLAALTTGEVDAVLAHEFAHLERCDPRWFFAVGFIQAALWMQPLNHWLAARVRRTAEIACDDRAVALTGDALGLAHALARLAHAAFGAGYAAFPAIARSPSVLVERVRRLTSPGGRASVAATHDRARSGVPVALLAALALASADLSVIAERAPVAGNRNASGPGTAWPNRGIDVAAMSRRAGELVGRERRLEAQIAYARGAAGGDPAGADADPRILQLEQDLRHAREERAWLEQSAAEQASP
jgi:beta-lactamase regulating signal transducer with metallopeptidase domain